MNRAVYAHWLDPEYLTWRATGIFDMQRRRQKIEALLKWHAAVGDCIRLSDVQLTDSLAILQLFSNADFRKFVQAYPDFLSLCSRTATRFDKVQSDKLAAVLSGLERSLDDNWLSSTFEDVGIVKAIANKLKDVRNEDIAAQQCKLQLKTAQNENVAGLLYGLIHFCSFPDRVLVSSEKPAFYDLVLKDAEARLIQAEVNPARVQTTLDFIEGYPDEEKHRRTPAILALHAAGLNVHENRVKYFNVIQAWNIGVSNTIQAHRDEAPAFEIVDSLPLYFGEFKEAALEARMTLNDSEFLEQFSRSNWHPAQLTWDAIHRMRDNKACQARIAQYQQRLTMGEDVGQEYVSLIAAIGAALSEERFGALEGVSELTSIGKDVGQHLVSFGKAISTAHPAVGFMCLLGAKAAGVPHDVTKLALKGLRAKSRREIATGLEDYAIRYNLERWTHHGEKK